MHINKDAFIVKQHHVLTFFYFGLGIYVWPSNCCLTGHVALEQKMFGDPCTKWYLCWQKCLKK